MSPRFDRLYSTTGRPSIPPEKLLRALLLQMLYSIRSERLLMEELDYNILYRWFVGLSLDDPIWDATTFTKNRDRLLDGDVADAFFAEVLAAIKAGRPALRRALHGRRHAARGLGESQEFQTEGRADRTPPDDPKNPTVNFHGQTRRNDTHQSTTDPDARLYKKAVGREAKLGYLGHLLTENRHGFIIDTAVTDASGTGRTRRGDRDARRVAADDAAPHRRRRQAVRHARLGRRRATDAHHAARGPERIRVRRQRDRRAHDPTRRAIALSHRKRKLIEQAFGWLKTVALFRKLRHRGGRLVDWLFSFGAAAYNLVRWRNLVAQRA